jgi:hypothetical protein
MYRMVIATFVWLAAASIQGTLRPAHAQCVRQVWRKPWNTKGLRSLSSAKSSSRSHPAARRSLRTSSAQFSGGGMRSSGLPSGQMATSVSRSGWPARSGSSVDPPRSSSGHSPSPLGSAGARRRSHALGRRRPASARGARRRERPCGERPSAPVCGQSFDAWMAERKRGVQAKKDRAWRASIVRPAFQHLVELGVPVTPVTTPRGYHFVVVLDRFHPVAEVARVGWAIATALGCPAACDFEVFPKIRADGVTGDLCSLPLFGPEREVRGDLVTPEGKRAAALDRFLAEDGIELEALGDLVEMPVRNPGSEPLREAAASPSNRPAKLTSAEVDRLFDEMTGRAPPNSETVGAEDHFRKGLGAGGCYEGGLRSAAVRATFRQWVRHSLTETSCPAATPPRATRSGSSASSEGSTPRPAPRRPRALHAHHGPRVRRLRHRRGGRRSQSDRVRRRRARPRSRARHRRSLRLAPRAGAHEPSPPDSRRNWSARTRLLCAAAVPPRSNPIGQRRPRRYAQTRGVRADERARGCRHCSPPIRGALRELAGADRAGRAHRVQRQRAEATTRSSRNDLEAWPATRPRTTGQACLVVLRLHHGSAHTPRAN